LRLHSDALLRVAAVGALMIALGVSGCGRKSGLDPPPAASALPSPAEGQPEPPPVLGPDGRPVAPKNGQRRWTPLDWLID
jgi:predicted small lipoprotein YifL